MLQLKTKMLLKYLLAKDVSEEDMFVLLMKMAIQEPIMLTMVLKKLDQDVPKKDLMKEFTMTTFIKDMLTMPMLKEPKDVLNIKLEDKKLMIKESLIDSQELPED